jgi:hypothetical protein
MMRRFTPIIVGSVLVCSGYTATHYKGWLYRGGPLFDHGILSRPRYEAQFPAVPLNAAGSYQYPFSRFPAADALVMLATPSGPSVASIERLATRATIRVVDQRNAILCEAAGSPTGTGDERLIITSSMTVLGLWHMRCGALDLRACAPCRLQISIGPVDPMTPAVLILPTIQGGGV